MQHRILAILACIVLSLGVLTACTDNNGGAQTDPAVDDQQNAPGNTEDGTVDLEIIEGAGGSVIVFVPVYIRGEGPFDFVLDTGASRSVVDVSVADQFDLPQSDTPGDVTGVGGTAEVDLVQIDEWSMGADVALPELQITVFSVFDDQDAAMIEDQIGREIQGLLGSDALSYYGVISIDFEQSQLITGS